MLHVFSITAFFSSAFSKLCCFICSVRLFGNWDQSSLLIKVVSMLLLSGMAILKSNLIQGLIE